MRSICLILGCVAALALSGCASCPPGCDGCGGWTDNCGTCSVGGACGGQCGIAGCNGSCRGGRLGKCGSCGGAGCRNCGHDFGPRRPGKLPQVAPEFCRTRAGRAIDNGNPGPPSASYAYPYYTHRGPRDFLVDNPPTIGY